MAKILIVDDSRSILEMLKVTLEQEGHEIISLKSGLKAIEFAQNNKVDLVITDINMPGITGITLVSKLRELPDYEFLKVPILMLTVESSDEKKEKSRSAGANGWLQKPFNAPILIKTVHQILQKYKLS